MKIIFSIMIAMFIIGCSEDAAKQEKAPVAEEAAVVEIAQTVKEVAAVVEQATEVVAEKVIEETATANGALLYSKCVACHGKNGEKSALNKSAIIANWSVTQVQDALNGYKAGTYGGAMKGMMIGQVKSLSEADITAIAEHIAKK